MLQQLTVVLVLLLLGGCKSITDFIVGDALPQESVVAESTKAVPDAQGDSGLEKTTSVASVSATPEAMTSPVSMTNLLSNRIVTELVKQNDALRPNQPVVVATPVLVGSMSGTNTLALQLQQDLMTSLHSAQFSVVDLNLGSGIRVSPDGDFILTRDWQQLPDNIVVEHVVVSTMSLATNGMEINTRVVNINNNRVVSVAQTFVTQAELDNYMQLSEKVVSYQGLLYRHDRPGMNEVRVLGDTK